MGEDNPLKQQKDIILFDGVCNLCNGTVQFVIRHDPQEKFAFAALQSLPAQKLLSHYNYQAAQLSSIVVVTHIGQVLTKSDAALYIAGYLSGAWKWLRILYIFPKPLRDWVYDLIAKYRYSLFGKRKECMIPTPENKQRFLE